MLLDKFQSCVCPVAFALAVICQFPTAFHFYTSEVCSFHVMDKISNAQWIEMDLGYSSGKRIRRISYSVLIQLCVVFIQAQLKLYF